MADKPIIQELKDLTVDLAASLAAAMQVPGQFRDDVDKVSKMFKSSSSSLSKMAQTISEMKPLKIVDLSSIKNISMSKRELEKMVLEYSNLKRASAAASGEELVRLTNLMNDYGTQIVKVGGKRNDLESLSSRIIKENVSFNNELLNAKFEIENLDKSELAALAKKTGLMEKISSIANSIIPKFTQMRLAVNAVGFGWGIVFFLVEEMVRRFITLDSAAGEFRKKTGLITKQMIGIAEASRRINVELGHFGVRIEDVYNSVEALYTAFQTTHLITENLIKTSAMLAANIGIAVEDTALFRTLFTKLSAQTGMVADDIIHASIGLAAMAGVAPAAVMKDMATASENTLKFLAKNPLQLMRTSVEARRLGTTLKSMADSARGLLNYQESMTNELEASALLNRNVSFQYARQLAWEGKISESRQEALRQISMAGDFTSMNVLQQEALAKAAGLTVDEVIKQQNQEKILLALKNSSLPKDREIYSQYEKMNVAIKERRKSAEKDLVQQGRDAASTMSRQIEVEKIVNAIKGAWLEVTDAMIPVALDLLPTIQEGSKTIAAYLKTVARGVKDGMPVLLGLSKILIVTAKFLFSIFTGILEPVKDILTNFEKIRISGTTSAETLSKMLGTATSLGKAIGEIPIIFSTVLTSLKIIGYMGNLLSGITSITTSAERFSSVFINLITRVEKMGFIMRALLAPLYGPLGIVFGLFSKTYDILSRWSTKIASFGSGVGKFSEAFSTLFKWVGSISNVIKDIGSGIATLASGISKFSFVGKIAMFFGKWLNPIGWIITGIQFLYNLFENFSKVEFIKGDWLGNILKGMKAVGGAIYDTLLEPFVSLWKWFDKHILGHSPSLLGELIVQGISSIGSSLFETLIQPFKSASSAIYDFIVSPFTRAWDFIKNIPLVKNLFGTAKDVASSVSNQIQTSVEAATTAIVEVKNLNELKDVIAKLTEAVIALGNISSKTIPSADTKTVNNQVLEEKIEALTQLFRSGVKIDTDFSRLIAGGR